MMEKLFSLMAQADPVDTPKDSSFDWSSLNHLTDNEMVNSILGGCISVLGAGILLIAGIMIAKHVKKFAIKTSAKAMHDDGTSALPKFIGSCVYYLLLVVIVLTCLSIFGIETTSFAAILASAGLAIGLAFQGTLSNLAAGVMLIVFSPFKLNDFITGGGVSGVVTEIGLFTTKIRSLDNRVITVPNSALSGSTIDNCSTEKFRRADVCISVPYSSDLASVRSALERAMDVEGALAECEDGTSHVYLVDLTPGGTVNYQVRVWCKSADYWAVRERVTMKCKVEIDTNGVAITSAAKRRADVNVGVAYEADLDATRKALEAAIADCKPLCQMENPDSAVVLCDLGESSVNYQLRLWCKGDQYWTVKEALTIAAKRQLDKAGIEIPFPQVTVSNKK